jgi:hypothetical protein
VGITIGHELRTIDATQHPEPLARHHRSHSRLTDVVEIVPTDEPDAVEAREVWNLQVTSEADKRAPSTPLEEIIWIDHEPLAEVKAVIS